MMSGLTNLDTFREVQRMNSVLWVMLVIYGVTALIWWGFISQIILDEPWGSNPAPDWLMWLLWLGIGIGLPILFNIMRLIVEVRPVEVFIRYFPIHTRTIPLAEISQVEAREYSPIREYGGWGIRGWSSKTAAYNVKGNQGVELTLFDGRKIMIGSQKAESLAIAIIARMQLAGLQPN